MLGVNKYYDNNVEALKNINVTINKGEFVFLVGPSGAGKSTFMKLLYCEELPSKGKIIINQQEVTNMKRRHLPRLRRSLGVVFQDYHLLAHRTVYDNVAFAMRVIEASKKEIRRRVPKVLEMVGLHNRQTHLVEKLSGGEKQRTAIARAIVNKPAMLLTDEPTGNLDPATSKDIIDILERINMQGTTLIMATHDREVVDRLKKRVIRISDGKIIRDDLKGGYGDEN